MKTLLASAFLLTAATVHAAPAAPATQEATEAAAAALPSARSVVDRFIEVTGAEQLIENKKTLRMTGEASFASMGMKGKYQRIRSDEDQLVITVELSGMGEMGFGYDGTVAWRTHPMMGATILDGVELDRMRLQADWNASLKSPDLYESIRTVGLETFGGKECYKVETVAKPAKGEDAAKTKKFRTTTEFYEKETGLLAGSVSTNSSPMGEMAVTVVTSEYEEFDGLLLATKLVQQTPQGDLVLTVDTVEFDTVAPKEFELPAEVKKLAEK